MDTGLNWGSNSHNQAQYLLNEQNGCNTQCIVPGSTKVEEGYGDYLTPLVGYKEFRKIPKAGVAAPKRWGEYLIPATISRIKSSDQPLVGHQNNPPGEIKLIRSARSKAVTADH